MTGPGPAPIATNEAAASLVARLRRTKALATLTRPNGTAVWIKGATVTLVRPPIVGEIPPGEHVGAILWAGGQHQAVEEDVQTVRAAVNAHGGNV